ncbi:hypothetical protein G6F43_007375 [Rhizopus delemar]|nr:hypothetical protein G6F43_007375 [Rhizopus delemar]
MVHPPSNHRKLWPMRMTCFFSLRDPADLEATHQLIHCYNLASNAKMNFDKTIAFSVSGLPHPHWPPVLAAHGITKWHGRRSIEPLTYLGYPLVHSTT